ncbi:tripartite tricarboxylate transporter TctB family protein [uncultured Aeromicrobium sp.]|uniref:tripartite tricarboxylate transporter TctB family protein n=1 Tax=uncultured Aeromicrobium sp. TaxID=337820 RepID=UPI0025F8B8A3|nr:tripartite tricarboxylate transporter TctB family protein [uncultured Aeromicrobium sp.]
MVIALLCIGLYVTYSGITKFGVSDGQGGLGAGTLPVIAGAGLSVVCLVLMLRRSPLQERSAKPVRGSTVRPWSVFAVLVAAVVLVNSVGFVVMTAAVTYVLLAWVERMSHVKSATIGLVVSVAVWAVFDAFIKVPLPPGTIWAA